MKLSRLWLISLLAILLGAGCARRGDELDPNAGFWKKVPGVEVNLVPQTITLPRGGSEKQVTVQATRHKDKLLFRLSWPDESADLVFTGDKFSDGVAIMFPLSTSPLPAPFMGDKENPVQIWHWRADWQFQEEEQKEVAQSYPAYADWYPPHEPAYFKGVGRHPQPDRAMIYAAKGFGTLTPQPSDAVAARGAYDAQQKKWYVVFATPAAALPFAEDPINFNTAVWDGAKGERGARKSVSMSWQEITLAGKE